MQNTKKNYQIGLDLGTSSVGWAVVDDNNKLIKKRGKNLWGVRLFEGAESAEGRRTKRRQRRTIQKRSWRLLLLRKELEEFVLKEDKEFYQKLKLSQTKPSGYFLFNGKFNDTTYHRNFPTIFHLRLALMDQKQVEKWHKEGLYYRFLFLAVNDILKTRGNFLSEGRMETSGVSSEKSIIEELNKLLEQINFEEEILDQKFILTSVKDILKKKSDINYRKQDPSTTFLKAITGRNFDLNKIVKLSDDKIEITYESELWEEKLTGNIEIDNLLQSLFELYSKIELFLILGDESSLSSVKVKIYENHKKQLKKLKQDLKVADKKLATNYYDEIFNSKDSKKISYSSYVGKVLENGKKISIPKYSKDRYNEFIKKLKNVKKEIDSKLEGNNLLKDVELDNYLLIPTNSGNRLIPYQIHYNELKVILENFVNIAKNENTQQIKNNILKLMEFKVPYYVGTLSNHKTNKDSHHWLVKNPGYENVKVTPYNIDEVVDKRKTNEAFIKRMLRSCTYLFNESCVQQETILYQSYIFYNTVNTLKLDDNYLTNDQKEILFEALVTKGSLTKKRILELLNKKDSELTGFSKENEDKPLTISLSAVKKFREIFPEYKENDYYMMFFDDVINQITFIDNDEVELKKEVINQIIKTYKNIKVNSDQLEKLTKLTSSRWGNLSFRFLKELELVENEETGEVNNLLSILKNSNKNLIQVIHTSNNIERIDNENNVSVDLNTHEAIHNYLKQKYISPQARRSIIQAVRIVDEIVKIMDGEKPSKIAIEFTREDGIKRETNPRLRQLKKAYEKVSEEYKLAISKLSEIEKNKQEDKLRSRKIYLYFQQLGKDMYTGEDIDFKTLLSDPLYYNIDHIFPQSRIKDDSNDNLVLTNSVINGKLGNITPLPLPIREKNTPFWKYLKDRGLISNKKYERLTRSNELTDQELEDFVNRQKTTLDWVNSETAKLLTLKFSNNKEDKNFIIFSKSRHVYSFRNELGFYKFRELNNFHHAHDAYLNVVLGKMIQSNLYVTHDNKFRTYNYERIFNTMSVDLIKYIRKVLNYHDILITKRTSIDNKGAFWDEQLVSKDKANDSFIPIKQGMDPKEYGGYRSAKTAFFTILEHKNQKTIIPILRYQCTNFYDNDNFNMDKFSKFINNEFPNHEIIIPIVPIGQKVVVDDVELLLTGKTGNNILFHVTGNLIVSKKTSNYLRSLFILWNRKGGRNITEEDLESFEINKKDNMSAFIEIYDKVFVNAESNKLYPKNTFTKLVISENTIEDFEKIDLLSQYNSLIMIINKLLSGYTSNQGKLFGKTFIDQQYNAKIDYKFSIIKESITGFYTKKIDINV